MTATHRISPSPRGVDVSARKALSGGLRGREPRQRLQGLRSHASSASGAQPYSRRPPDRAFLAIAAAGLQIR